MSSSAPSFTDLPWLGFDTETTGVNIHHDRLVTAALVLRRGGAHPAGPDLVRTWLADPGVPIPETATEVHGISTEYAQAHGRPVKEVLEEVAATLVDHWHRGFPVVAFNATYDLSLMEAELSRHGLPTLTQRLGHSPAPIIDPLTLDRALDRYRKGKKTLLLMAPVYGVDAEENAHTAEVDVAMTLDVLAGMAQVHAQKIGSLSAQELHDYQISAHIAWAEDFEQFLRRKNPDAHISRAWPLEKATHNTP
ncbi:MAG: exonuclease domain-containing protein [Actinomycetaceae bacterium]|nr:exonuclease domain-containing protein [Actinomycetaceae bacterium]